MPFNQLSTQHTPLINTNSDTAYFQYIHTTVSPYYPSICRKIQYLPENNVVDIASAVTG